MSIKKVILRDWGFRVLGFFRARISFVSRAIGILIGDSSGKRFFLKRTGTVTAGVSAVICGVIRAGADFRTESIIKAYRQAITKQPKTSLGERDFDFATKLGGSRTIGTMAKQERGVGGGFRITVGLIA